MNGLFLAIGIAVAGLAIAVGIAKSGDRFAMMASSYGGRVWKLDKWSGDLELCGWSTGKRSCREVQ